MVGFDRRAREARQRVSAYVHVAVAVKVHADDHHQVNEDVSVALSKLRVPRSEAIRAATPRQVAA